jgi:Uma2 family endonuclease
MIEFTPPLRHNFFWKTMTTNVVVPTRKTPVRRRATYEEYLDWTSESRVVEWVDGEIIEYMPPLIAHQHLTWFLFHLIDAFVEELELGKAGTAPTEIKMVTLHRIFAGDERFPPLG